MNISTGYSVQGNVAEAFRILNFMISKEILPNSYTLTALMKTCVTKGDWERARELLTIGTHTRHCTASFACHNLLKYYRDDTLVCMETAAFSPAFSYSYNEF
jgi:pentatricopeptide repeat protein